MNVTNNILVIGGTGKTGRKVVEGLKKQNQNVRIGSRNELPSFEWEDPNTWKKALEGIDKIYIVFYPDLAVPGAFEAIKGLTEAAKKSGVKKAVLLSGKGEKEAERCEQVVANSGMDYTLVRASWFNQNFSESFFLDPILAGHIALYKGLAKEHQKPRPRKCSGSVFITTRKTENTFNPDAINGRKCAFVRANARVNITTTRLSNTCAAV